MGGGSRLREMEPSRKSRRPQGFSGVPAGQPVVAESH